MASRGFKSDDFYSQFIFTLALFILPLIGTIECSKIDYPSIESLSYEICTFSYFKKETMDRRTSTTERYYIYVEEYNEPLVIDNNTFDKVNHFALSYIKEGSEITVSLNIEDDEIEVYSLKYKDKYVLSYEDYLDVHTRNSKIGVVVLSILSGIDLTLLIAEVVYFKKTGRGIPVNSRC